MIAWMVEDKTIHRMCGLYARTIQAFPAHFRDQKNTNLIRAGRWWAMWDRYFLVAEILEHQALSCSRSTLNKHRRVLNKAGAGRGSKHLEWIDWIYPCLLQSFETYKKAGIKFSPKLLVELAKKNFLGPDSPYTLASRDLRDNIIILEKFTSSWVYQFMVVHNVVLLSQRGHLTYSPEKETQIEMHTAYYLGVLQCGFQNGIFDENLIENLDETHFTVNMDNGRTLEFRGDKSVKYVDVVAGGEAMTMVVRISGGRGSSLEAPMIIFTNGNSNYPIRGLEDSIFGVSYHIGPKGWMDQSIFSSILWNPALINLITMAALSMFGWITIPHTI